MFHSSAEVGSVKILPILLNPVNRDSFHPIDFTPVATASVYYPVGLISFITTGLMIQKLIVYKAISMAKIAVATKMRSALLEKG